MKLKISLFVVVVVLGKKIMHRGIGGFYFRKISKITTNKIKIVKIVIYFPPFFLLIFIKVSSKDNNFDSLLFFFTNNEKDL